MKLASYKSTRPGVQGLFNHIIRWRFSGCYSHTELVFEPSDAVGQFMPDGTTAPDADGALWCASSVAIEAMPSYSPYRAGKLGGVRFKRVVLDPVKWDVIPLPKDAATAAQFVHERQGHLYNWRLIAKFLAWTMPLKDLRFSCSELAMAAAGFKQAWRFDPCTSHVAVEALI